MYTDFKHPLPAVDIVIFTIDQDKLKVLLIKMLKTPFEDAWAVPGGLVRLDESVDESAARTLEEKTGVKDVFLEQLYTFGDVKRDPLGRVISVAYFALILNKNIQLKTDDKRYGGVEWFDVASLPKLAYDHSDVVTLAKERLETKLEYTNIVCNLLPREFSLSEMQKAYEIILDRKLDKRNFQKKILSLALIKNTNKKTKGSASRPASLYKFKDKKLKNIQIL